MQIDQDGNEVQVSSAMCDEVKKPKNATATVKFADQNDVRVFEGNEDEHGEKEPSAQGTKSTVLPIKSDGRKSQNG